jgi:fibronectin type 3 domain-containing protein
MSKLFLSVVLVVLAGAMASPAHAFNHPAIPNSLEDLDTIKANLNREPWKSGYAKLAADGHSSLTYTMQGPFASVTRNPDLNLGAWQNDMTAVYNLAHMWYFTGNSAYAQKARDILIAWANTQTNMGGNQAGLALGDTAFVWGGGASILRGTWPGWTPADTAKVKNLFTNVYWPGTANPWNVPGTFNKGLINMSAGIAIAVFCDDTAKFNHVVDLYRTNPAAGLFNLLPIGETGETGRDAGHVYGGILNAAFVAECIWKQGIDVYADLDNRLLATGEYYCRNTFLLDNPFVDFGTVDALYFDNAEGPYGANRAAFHLIQNAYKNRKNIPTPWIDRKLGEQWLDGSNWLYAKAADFSTATPLPAVVRPAVSVASSGLTLTTLGSNSAGRSSSYSNGVWTVTGAGTGVSSGTDDCQFAYVQMTGDCAIVAQVTSVQATTATAMAGVMFRDTLSAPVSQRGWMAIWPTSPVNEVNSRMNGATEVWAGRVERQTDFPAGSGMPYWVKVERRGNLVTTYSSKDGTSWCPHISDYYGNLGATVYMGLFVMSGSASATTTATFANVAFTGGSGGLVTTPAAPAAVFTAGSAKAITVRWLPSFGATGYDLLRSTTSGSGYAAIASNLGTDKTSYVDTTAVAGTTYYYVVRAKNAVGTSGNSPEFYAALLSAPMVNLAFGGTPSASANSGSGYEKSDQAFNLDPGTKWIVPAVTGWLQYDFGSGNAQVVKRYTVSSADVAGRDPKDWQFLGSQDGSTWTTLDSQSGQVFANRVQQNVYNIGNTTAYRYYRINVTANNGDAFSMAISELGLWSDSGRTIPDGRYRLVNRKSNKVAAVTATTNGTPLVQSGWTGADSQQWDIAWQGNGRYRVTGVASAKVIDNGGTSNTGANLVIQPSSGATSQLWTINPGSDGFYRIASAHSGLVADVSGGSTANGANIIQWTYSGSDNQLWMPSIGVAPQPIPPAPTGLAATAATISQINLSWTASPGAISYTVKRAAVSGGPYTTVLAGVNTTNFSDTGLTSSTTYHYVVSAVNGSGEGSNSAQASATTLTAPPDAPTGVTTVLGSNQVTLNWAVSGGATSYTVKRSTTSGGPYATVASGVTATSYTDTGLTNGVAYYYVVSASNANGTGADSAEVSATTSTLVVQLKFDESAGATAADSSGRAYHATLFNTPTFSAGTFGNALNFPATASQYAKLPNGVTSGITDFTFSTWIKVNAFATWQRIFDFGSGTTNYMFLSTQYTATAPNNAKLRFTIRTPSFAEQTVSGTGIALTAGAWTHVAVTRSGTTVSIYVNGSLAGSGTIALSPADLGTTTLNYLGRSQFSDPYLNAALDDFRLYSQAMSPAEIDALAHPAAGAPTQLAVVPGDAQAALTWLPNATDTYTVKRSTTSGGPYTTVATGVTALTYTDTGLTNGTTYYYVVSGANSGGSGPDSAEVSVTPSTLRLLLKFDESSGSVAADSSGTGRNATLVNAPAFAAGRFDNGLTLAAASAQYGTLPAGIVNGLTNFTLSTWIKVNAFATWQRIFDFGTGTNNYMYLTTQYTTTAPNAAKLRFAIRTPSISEQTVSGTAIALTAGAWTHVAVTRSGTTVSIYVNGSLAGSGTIALNPSDLGTTMLNYLGKSQFGSDPYLDAALDDFRLYSQALSPAEIALHAAPPAAPQNLAAAPGPLSLDLTWDAVPNATSYTVKYATTSGGPYTTLATGLTGTSYLHSGLTYGTTYYYVVSAGNSLYDAPFSAELAATPDSAPITDAEAAPAAFDFTQVSGGNVGIATLTTATSVAGHSYQLQTRTDLAAGQWIDVGDAVLGNGFPIEFEIPYSPTAPRSFYRILITR